MIKYFVDGRNLIESSEDQLGLKEVSKAEFDFLVEKSKRESEDLINMLTAQFKKISDEELAIKREKVDNVLSKLGLTLDDLRGLL